MTAEKGRFTRGAKFLEINSLDSKILWSGQDESHGFIYNDYPIEVVRPLPPASCPAKGGDAPEGEGGVGRRPDRFPMGRAPVKRGPLPEGRRRRS